MFEVSKGGSKKMIYKHKSYTPKIDTSCFVAPSADIIGQVTIGADSTVWYNAVLRGDVNQIIIGRGTNIQDNCTVHNSDDYPTVVGDHVTVGHNVLLHGCHVGNNSLVGMGSTLLDGAEIGEFTIIGANSLVTQNKKIPSGVLAIGSPAKVVRELTEEEKENLKKSALHYIQSGHEHKRNIGF